ncbi:MAG: hypothetical protein P1U34_04685 [Coxiellaceae bacterium]|nr:hypothetical protein [Coxiellaceae bacterium]
MNTAIVVVVAVCSVLMMSFFVIDTSQLSQLSCGSYCDTSNTFDASINPGVQE